MLLNCCYWSKLNLFLQLLLENNLLDITVFLSRLMPVCVVSKLKSHSKKLQVVEVFLKKKTCKVSFEKKKKRFPKLLTSTLSMAFHWPKASIPRLEKAVGQKVVRMGWWLKIGPFTTGRSTLRGKCAVMCMCWAYVYSMTRAHLHTIEFSFTLTTSALQPRKI